MKLLSLAPTLYIVSLVGAQTPGQTPASVLRLQEGQRLWVDETSTGFTVYVTTNGQPAPVDNDVLVWGMDKALVKKEYKGVIYFSVCPHGQTIRGFPDDNFYCMVEGEGRVIGDAAGTSESPEHDL